MKRITILNLLVLIFSASILKAQTIINPVSATTTLSAQFGSSIGNTIDGSGLAVFPSLMGVHAATDPFNSFLATNAAGSVDFDLGNTFMVDGFSFWNQNGPGPGMTGFKDVIISSSTDGITFTPIPGSPIAFAQNMAPTTIEEEFTFTAVSATHIRIDVSSNHGDPGNLIAFAEIAFTGTIPTPTPTNVINPVSATTTLSAQFGSDIVNTINGSGLPVFPALTGAHAATDPFNSFLATNAAGSMDFDLGGIYLVDGLSFWNQNGPGPGMTGIKDVVISTSMDGITFTPIGGSPTVFAQVMAPTSTEEQFAWPAVAATHIRFDVTSNYGDPGNLIAFAEIAFTGVQSQLSTAEVDFASFINFYPNPAADYITIDNTSNTELSSLDIYSINGALIKKLILSNSKNERIDISNLSRGIYMFHVHSDHQSVLKKVIKK